jgi:hypothetical protein
LGCREAKKPPAIIHTTRSTVTSPFGGPNESNSTDRDKNTTPSTATTQTSVASLPSTANTNTTTSTDMAMDPPKTPTKNTPTSNTVITNSRAPPPDNQNNQNMMTPPNAATNTSGDLTITPRQINMLNFNEFDNESAEAEVLQKTRCDIRLNIRPTGRFATVQDVIREARAFVQELRNCDPTVMILPWYTTSSDTTHALSLNEFPTNMKDLNRYFPRLRSQTGDTWGDVCFVHTNDYGDILTLCQNWLDSEGHGMYKKRLQCITVKCIGWLLFSFRAIDIRALSDKLEEEYNLKAEFRFAGINLDRTPIPIEHQIRALHIWIAADSTFVPTKRIFQAMYSSTATTFPLDIKMRLVPMVENLSKKKQIDQVMKLKGRQSQFLVKIAKTSCISWDIANLDSPVGGLPSLRSLIMDARPSSGRGSLFISVDYAYKRNDLVIFSFLPIYAIEARAFAAKVAAHIILKNRSNEAVYEYFTPEACMASEDVEWDEATQQIITKEDKYLDDLIALEDDMWLFDDDDTPAQTQTVEVSHTPTRIENIFLGNCDDSVGTLRSNVTSRSQVPPRPTNSNATTSTGSSTISATPSTNNQSQGTRRFANMEASVNQWVNATTSRPGSTSASTNDTARTRSTTQDAHQNASESQNDQRSDNIETSMNRMEIDTTPPIDPNSNNTPTTTVSRSPTTSGQAT